MLIKALCDYYDILASAGKVLPEGYSKVRISYLISLTPEGKIERIVDWQQKEETADKKGKIKTRFVPRNETMFRRTEATTVCSSIIEHRPLYIFGLNYADGGFTAEDKTGKAEKSHKDFVEKNLAFIEGVNSPVVNAFRCFLECWQPEAETENPLLLALGKSYATAGYAFCLSGDPTKLLHNDPALKEKWAQQPDEADDAKVMAQCSITGENAALARIHNKIKGVPGGLATGSVLIGYKESAFSSYGSEQSYNSCVSEEAMGKYTEALNYLLANKNHHTSLDEVTVLHWAMSESETYDELCNDFIFSDSPTIGTEELDAVLKALVEGMREGKINQNVEGLYDELDMNTDFYLVGLKPNSARLTVKFIYRRHFGELLKNVQQHRLDMRAREDAKSTALWRIKAELVSPKSSSDKADPALMAKLLEAVIHGTNYPPYLLSTLVRRVKTDSNDDKNQFIKMNDTRIGMIKACINRKSRLAGQKEDIKMALDPENGNSAYLCGRLFAVLEKLQQDASNNSLNRTIKDAYFASAASRPAIIFPNLLKLAQNHITKASYGGYWNRTIGEIMNSLGGEFPQTLPLTEQGKFIIGYYQQFYDKAKKDN